MKWIVTKTLRVDKTDFYVRWLDRNGVACSLVGVGDGVPLNLTHSDALLLTGGGDVSPDLYGTACNPATRDVVPERDRLEIDLVRRFRAARKPVFGVCRGIQVLTVALGGKLVQHIPDIVPPTVEKHRPDDPGGPGVRHAIRWTRRTGLPRALLSVAEVNSFHHQAVDPAAPGQGLRIAALSAAGVVEAVQGPGLFAVQWHPERLPAADPASSAVFAAMRAIADRNVCFPGTRP